MVACVQYIRRSSHCHDELWGASQGMILISDPAYNEPNVEQMRGTTEGNQRSFAYNVEVRAGRVDCMRNILHAQHSIVHSRNNADSVLASQTVCGSWGNPKSGILRARVRLDAYFYQPYAWQHDAAGMYMPPAA